MLNNNKIKKDFDVEIFYSSSSQYSYEIQMSQTNEILSISLNVH